MKNTEPTGTELSLPASTELLLLVPAEHPCYADHFPGNPLVPGALLLKWILARIEQEYHCRVLLLKSIKFLAPVKPGNYLTIKMNTNLLKMQLSFDIFVLDTLVIKGSVECENRAHQHRDFE